METLLKYFSYVKTIANLAYEGHLQSTTCLGAKDVVS
jgi:hypothetical protein